MSGQEQLITFGPFWENTFWMVRQFCGLFYKSFVTVIYDRNDSTIVEPLL